ncbi:hypothetical protein SNE40_014999 [Patella caerulea]|uniref:Sugar phosphate exchanger 3 n=1 Tax=Patella caerulea TaxID=87958 RepID=A0AAN8JFU3_PATCE
MHRKITFYHLFVFFLTFLSYSFFHAARKTFSNVKSTISEEWTPTFNNETVNITKPYALWNKRHLFENDKDAEIFLGVLDATFLISYAVGLYISGMVGDRLDMRKVLAFGMCSSALSIFIFGCVLEWVHFYNKYVYVIIWVCNGLLQSTGWPTVVAVMGNWFGHTSRGLVLGLWSACASVGNIIGAFMVSSVLDYGYDYAFLFTSSVLFGGGFIILFGLVSTPAEVGLKESSNGEFIKSFSSDTSRTSFIQDNPEVDLTDQADAPLIEDSDIDISEVRVEVKAISFCQALLLPGVILYSLSYAFLKLVNYSFFFWLPFYLVASFNWKATVADKISIWYDVGGIIGGTVAGVISDLCKHRAVVVVPMLILSIPALFIYGNSSGVYSMNAFLMGVTGFFIGGVANLISAAISADLGQQGPIKGNNKALATVTGIVDGTGSVGAAIGQILVPVIQTKLGWKSVFIFFMITMFLTTVCVFPIFIQEIRTICCQYTYRWNIGLQRKSVLEDNIIEQNSDQTESEDIQ